MLAENRVSSPGKRRKGWQRGESRVYERRRNIIVVCLAVLQLWVIADSIWQLLRIFEANPDVLFVLTSSISETIYGGRGFSLFFTLLAWAEGVSSKNKTHVPPGLWEQGPPAYCFGIRGEDWEDLAWRDSAEWIQTERERVSERGEGRAAVLFKKRVEEIFSLARDYMQVVW